MSTATPLRAIDSAEVSEGTVRAVKKVAADDPYMPGHFPELTVYPGVFTLESVQQAVAEAVGPVRLARLRSARFLAPLLAGDSLVVEAAIERADDGLEVRARCADGTGRTTAKVSARYEQGSRAATDVGARLDRHRPRSGELRLDHDAIRAVLPHRHPMILLDRIEHAAPGERLEAVKAVSGCEPCYQGDQPGSEYPASLLLESFGQAAAVLWLLGATESGLPMFTAARDVVFERPVLPGDVVRHLVRLDQVVDGAAFASGESFVGADRVAVVTSMMAVVRPALTLTNGNGRNHHE
ncbi:hypothetical protein N5079_23330 [Planotetraspora sp. A-T 1434]|uniref:hypothetical protein n=1 Tax=Planotetraspora sp. A-T 1434 TaxID=2979219 RepID=UPI0021C1D231|nr:hypothetical protein [Planotetraspora sp. A-T 1434]MCT9933146.1 hypothetical protein [Planotetraspora sp. A-T 1434]